VVPNFGVLTGLRSTLGGFRRQLTGWNGRSLNDLVRVADAIAILDDAAPGARSWLRENALHLIRPGQLFGFELEVCEEIDGPASPGTRVAD
jgi:hypothetical protein